MVPGPQEAMEELERVTEMGTKKGGGVPAPATQRDDKKSLDSSV